MTSEPADWRTDISSHKMHERCKKTEYPSNIKQINPYPHGLLNEAKPPGGGGAPYQKHSKRLDLVTKLSTEMGLEEKFR